VHWGGKLASALGALLLLSPTAAANEYALTRARTLYQQMTEGGQCEAALPSARQFWPSTEFATLDVEVRHVFLGATIGCAASLNDYAQAIAAARAARDLNAAWADYSLMLLGLDSANNQLVIQSFDAMNASAPQYIKNLEYRTVWRLLRAIREADPSGASELRMHEALVSQGYVPPEAVPDDAIRQEHARLLLAHGDVARARDRLAPITDPQTLLRIRIDRRYDALRNDPSFEQQFDIAAAVERHIARARETIAASPRLLGPWLELVQSIRLLGRREEALAEVDRILARAQSPEGASLFDDYEDQLNWLLNERSYILYDLNRREEARTTFGQAIGVGESGNWNVSQVINLASRLQAEGRSAEAVDVLRTVGRASPYGDMWVAAVRACAGEDLDDAAMRDEAMSFLRAHDDDNPAALTRGLLCVNDLDGAAAAYVRRLGNPEHREVALMALQIYEPSPVVLSEQEAELDRRKAAVRDRPEVRAAVEAVGRIERVPLHSVYWGGV
jgi:tetratricopeptide (TPR) repeat protein